MRNLSVSWMPNERNQEAHYCGNNCRSSILDDNGASRRLCENRENDMNHEHYCHTLKHSDAAKRIFDTYTLHRLADPIGNIGKWFAVSMQDGTTDNALYDSKVQAMRHQSNEYYYTYVQVVPSQMSICDAELF